MAKFILKRTLLMIPTLLIVMTVVFVLMHVVPGSPVHGILSSRGEDVTQENVEALEAELGLDDPIIVQYLRYMKGIFTGDWGVSYSNGKPTFQNIRDVMEPTIMYGLTYFVIHMITAIPVGIYCAVHRNSGMDYAMTFSSMAFMVVPSFCLALLGIYFFGFKLGWFPVVGYTSIERGGFWVALYHVLLPAIVSGLSGIAGLARQTRSTMLDVLNQDYIRTARAKGLSNNMVYYKHALKNTLSVTGSMVIGSFIGAVGGSSIIEKVFNIKGMGRLALESLSNRDHAQMMAIVLFSAFIGLATNLICDIVYKLIDPRIEYE